MTYIKIPKPTTTNYTPVIKPINQSRYGVAKYGTAIYGAPDVYTRIPKPI